MEKTYQISEGLINEVVSILGSLPFAQVAQTITKLQVEVSNNTKSTETVVNTPPAPTE